MALLLPLFPRLGASIFDEDGVLVPVGGGRYDVLLPFYDNLCRRGDLVQDDPLNGVGGALVPDSPYAAVPAIFPQRFGAVGNDVADDTAAIQSAIDAAAAIASATTRARVVVSRGVFRTTAKLVMRDNVTLEFVDAKVHATSDCAIECAATKYGVLLRPHLLCDSGVSGIRLIAGSGPGLYTRDVLIENPTIVLATTGVAAGIKFQQTGALQTSGDLHFFPRIVNPKIMIAGGGGSVNASATGIDVGGTFLSSSVRGRIVGGTFEGVGNGIVMNHCNTWSIETPVFNFVLGDAISLGSDTQQCGVLYPDYEDCGVYFRNAGSFNWVRYSGEFTATVGVNQCVNTGASSEVEHAGYQMMSRTSRSTLRTRRELFQSTFEMGCYEPKYYTPGETITALADNSNSVSPRIRLSSWTSPGDVTVSGISTWADYDPADPVQGDLRIIHKADAGNLIIAHESGGATARNRTTTLSGGAETYPGPCTVLAVYDKTRSGGGAGRFLCMGSLSRPAAPRADSVAATVGALVTDFNDLLAKLRAAGIVRT